MSKIILVTGATGMQGGATVDALLANGFTVRALVRDPQSASSSALAARGVELARGDFDDLASLDAAMHGVDGVFSMQLPPLPGDLDSEVRAGRNLVEAAKRAGVDMFVHTSVARAGDQEHFVGWAEGRWWPDYWNSKSAVNDLVRSAGFPHWTVLKPAFMMENFIPPKAAWMFPQLSQGFIGTAMAKGARLDLIAASDVGRFAAAAFADPDRFNGQDITLAAEALDMDAVAAIIAEVTGKAVVARHMTTEEAVSAGNHPGLVSSQEWASIEGYKVDLARAHAFGIPLERFADWARRHSEDFEIAVR
ncbi:NmrA family NAD(P)-binding protein [Sphingobium sp. HBC34]|uniref:NmrA family NAD(P)-binding protein n=1 Tax=Sphingobium cyanobacteriorum TaxID=3063954 RepID=A0ABT8ZIP9_9SPHN|nr:NmrA family NAD(P)-binding protein [Sphingobium sp. HBC34]MDO7834410.1 NmrA family NAD(P)-binding protein [Sphingobium sp. HBC34]